MVLVKHRTLVVALVRGGWARGWGLFRRRRNGARVCEVRAPHKKVFTSQKGLRSMGGPDLLNKSGVSPGEGSNLLKSRRPLMICLLPPGVGQIVTFCLPEVSQKSRSVANIREAPQGPRD